MGSYLPFECMNTVQPIRDLFPSPLWGLIFHSRSYRSSKTNVKSFRPLFGDLSSIQVFVPWKLNNRSLPSPRRGLTRYKMINDDLKESSVPSSGTDLPFKSKFDKEQEKTEFPFPLRGLIFHFVEPNITHKVLASFRPLFGDLSSISYRYCEKD